MAQTNLPFIPQAPLCSSFTSTHCPLFQCFLRIYQTQFNSPNVSDIQPFNFIIECLETEKCLEHKKHSIRITGLKLVNQVRLSFSLLWLVLLTQINEYANKYYSGGSLLNCLLLLCTRLWEMCVVGIYEHVMALICGSESNLRSWFSLFSFMMFGTTNLCVSFSGKHFTHWDLFLPWRTDVYM